MNYSSGTAYRGQPVPAESDGASDFIDIERLVAVALRQTKIVALSAGVALVLGVLYLQTTPRTYVSAASVLVDNGIGKTFDPVSPIQTTLETDADILSQIEIIRSERLASVVADKLQLDRNETFLFPPSSLLAKAVGTVRGIMRSFIGSSAPSLGSAPPMDEAARQAAMVKARKLQAVALLLRGVRATRVGRTNVIAIGYEGYDPALANAITDAYTQAFLADQLEATFDSTERAAVWLQERLVDLRQSSQAAARAVEDFRAANGLNEADGQLISEQRLSELNTQLILAQADTAKALARFQQLQALVDSGAANAIRNMSVSAAEPADSVTNTLRTRYIEISRRAQEVAANFGESHPQAVALRAEQTKLEQQLFSQIQQLAQSARSEYEVALSRETALRGSADDASGQNADARQSQVQLAELQQKADALSQLYQTFLARHEEAIQQQSFPIAKLRLLSEASMPLAASSPRTVMVLGLSLVLGLMVGGGLGLLNEFNERFFRTGDDVRDRLGAKFLGYLPIVSGIQQVGHGGPSRKFGVSLQNVTLPDKEALRVMAEQAPAQLRSVANSAWERFAIRYLGRELPPEEDAARRKAEAAAYLERMHTAVRSPASPFAETLRNVKIATDLVLSGLSCKVVGMISALPSEGKSTVSANFAELLALNGARVLLIDGDLRNPSLTRGLGMAGSPGLVETVSTAGPGVNPPR